MKERKTREVERKQTKISEDWLRTNNFLHSADISAATLVIWVRKLEHTVRPEVCCHS